MVGLIEKSVLAGLGVLTLTRDKLVARGEAEREELRKLVREELDKARASVTPVSRQDIEELNRKLDELAAQVEKLAKKKTTQKSA